MTSILNFEKILSNLVINQVMVLCTCIMVPNIVFIMLPGIAVQLLQNYFNCARGIFLEYSAIVMILEATLYTSIIGLSFSSNFFQLQ